MVRKGWTNAAIREDQADRLDQLNEQLYHESRSRNGMVVEAVEEWLQRKEAELEERRAREG